MSMNTKLFVRPKVRFCQTDTDESMKKATENSTDPKCESRPTGKPRIKSIVTLNKPVKLVKSNETVGIHHITDSRLIDNAQNIYSLSSNAQTHPSLSTQTSSSLDVNTSRAEKLPSLNDANNTQNIKANSKQVDTQSSPIKLSDYDTIVPVASLQRSEDLNKTNKPNHYTKNNSSKKDSMKVKKGNEKENEARNAKKVVKRTAIKSSELSASKTKAKLCSAGTSVRPPNIRNKPSISNGSKRDLHSKPIAVGVMPCHKHNKVASKVKVPYVKKTVVRDIIGPKIKPCIEPGVSHKKSDIVKLPETDETLCTKPIASGDKLARPEYNSIMCTINKLNEMKKEKAAHDIEHLSPAYKSLINEKISTALDYPLDEAIYKNLVDLTVDENQLPCRLTRSKDPEPRQKDVVPVLSDFFTPASTEEYCTSVSSKPRTPENVDSWSAFRISDQICEWKYILDHI